MKPTLPPPPPPARIDRLARLAALAALCALAACGGGSGGGGGAIPTAAPPPPAPTPEPPAPEPPAPTPPAPAPTPGVALSCLNDKLYATTGTTLSATYRLSEGGATKQVLQTTKVEGPTTFNGQTATRLSVNETVSASGATDQRFGGEHYVTLDSAGLLQLKGTKSTFAHGGRTVTQTLALTPGAPELDFSLAAGAAHVVTSAAAASYTGSTSPPTSFNATVTLTYVGTESVTVPAGTFADACKFSQQLMSSSTQTTTRWVARGSGVVLKSVNSGGAVQELVSATIDGVAVTP